MFYFLFTSLIFYIHTYTRKWLTNLPQEGKKKPLWTNGLDQPMWCEPGEPYVRWSRQASSESGNFPIAWWWWHYFKCTYTFFHVFLTLNIHIPTVLQQSSAVPTPGSNPRASFARKKIRKFSRLIWRRYYY